MKTDFGVIATVISLTTPLCYAQLNGVDTAFKKQEINSVSRHTNIARENLRSTAQQTGEIGTKNKSRSEMTKPTYLNTVNPQPKSSLAKPNISTGISGTFNSNKFRTPLPQGVGSSGLSSFSSRKPNPTMINKLNAVPQNNPPRQLK